MSFDPCPFCAGMPELRGIGLRWEIRHGCSTYGPCKMRVIVGPSKSISALEAKWNRRVCDNRQNVTKDGGAGMDPAPKNADGR